jgi:glutamate dehydrogenase (NADP+)
MLRARGDSFDGKTCVVSGSGNVAIYTVEKIHEMGGKVVTCSDSDGVIYDPSTASTSSWCSMIKNVERGRISTYAERESASRYLPGGNPGDSLRRRDARARRRTRSRARRAHAGQERLHRWCPKAPTCRHDARGVRVFLDAKIALRPGQGGQRRRRGHVGPGDVAELRATSSPGPTSLVS